MTPIELAAAQKALAFAILECVNDMRASGATVITDSNVAAALKANVGEVARATLIAVFQGECTQGCHTCDAALVGAIGNARRWLEAYSLALARPASSVLN